MVFSGRVPDVTAGVTLGVWQVWGQLLVWDTGPGQCLFLWGSSNTLLLAEDIGGMWWPQCCFLEGQLLNCSKIASFPCFVSKVTVSLCQPRINGTVWWVWLGERERKAFLWLLAYLSFNKWHSSTALTSREGCWACLYLVILLHLAKDWWYQQVCPAQGL